MYRKRSLKRSLILALLLATLSSILGVAISRAAANQHAVFIPLVGFQSSTPPPPPAPAGEVVARGFINTAYYESGSYQVFGEVVNNLDVPVYNVDLIVTYRNAAGQIVAMDTAAPSLPRIEPRSSSPFSKRLLGDNVLPDITQFTVEVESWQTEGFSRPVTILSTKAYLGRSGVVTVVEGEGRNATEKVLWGITLVISFRNSAGEVAAVAWEYPVSGGLQPGQTFKYIYEAADPSLAKYTARVQGYGD